MSNVSVKVFNREGQLVGPLDLPRVEKTPAEWRALLTDEQFQVARAQGTERPFCGTLLDNKAHGVYACVLLPAAALRLERQVRLRHWLAQLLPADRRRERRHQGRSHATA